MSISQRSVAAILLEKLSPWGAFLFCEAMTGSHYIKFPHWGLGSIRVGDHKGIKKYKYRWRVRLDLGEGRKKFFSDRGTVVLEVSPDMIDFLVEKFEENAAQRGIRPGDRQTWDEHLVSRGREPAGTRASRGLQAFRGAWR